MGAVPSIAVFCNESIEYFPGTASKFIIIIIPGDRNVIQKEAENILKHKDLTIEIQRMWNVKTMVIPATGTISKSFRKHVSTIPGNHEVKKLQKSCHIEHCTHTSDSDDVKVQ
jgi:hypothetical protein